MTAPHNHIIQKQIIEVTLPSGKNANALQDKIKNIYYEKIIPLLDNLFSGFVKDDIVIRLDKLDIDLGHITEDNLEQQLTEKIVVAVKQQLESSLQFDVKDSRNVQLIPGGQSVINGFLYFLSQGHFPWWCGINDLSVLESAIIKQYKADKDLPAKILQLVNADAYITTRLNFQFSKSFRTFIIEKIFASQSITQRTFFREMLLLHDEFSAKNTVIQNNVDSTTINTQLKKSTEESKQNKEEKKPGENDQSSTKSSILKQNEQDNNEHTTLKSSPLSKENTKPVNEVTSKQSQKQDDINIDKTSPVNEENEIQQTGKLSLKENIDTETVELKNKTNAEADFLINQNAGTRRNVAS